MSQHHLARVFRAAIAVASLASAAGNSTVAQTTKDQSPPVAADLFAPAPVAFDFTPEQQRAIATFRADPSAGQVQVFRINLNVPKTADAVNFNFAPGSAFMLSTRSRHDRAPGDYSWLGSDEAGAKSAVLVVKNDQVTGTIRDGDRLYRLRPLGGGLHAVIEVDQQKLPPEHPPEFDKRDRETQKPPPRGDARGRVGSSATTTPFAADTAACGTIDILVAYTPAAEAQAGSIGGLIELAVLETNNSYARSGIQPRLRLVHQAPTTYIESGDMELDIARLTNPNDGFLDDLPPLRDAHNADIVVLVTGSGNFCGIAADILARADNAYAVVGQNCATGYYSFGHEVGHLQGVRHNPEADDTPTPFPYGHGFFSLSNRKRTIMSYDCPPGCTRIDVWANPQVVVQNVAMGDTTLRHDSRVLNETACLMASFRPAPASPEEVKTKPTNVPAFSAWSLLALLAVAPLVLGRATRA